VITSPKLQLQTKRETPNHSPQPTPPIKRPSTDAHARPPLVQATPTKPNQTPPQIHLPQPATTGTRETIHHRPHLPRRRRRRRAPAASPPSGSRRDPSRRRPPPTPSPAAAARARPSSSARARRREAALACGLLGSPATAIETERASGGVTIFVSKRKYFYKDRIR